MKAWTTKPAGAKGLQPGVHRNGEGCGCFRKDQLLAPERDQADGSWEMLGSNANAIGRAECVRPTARGRAV